MTTTSTTYEPEQWTTLPRRGFGRFGRLRARIYALGARVGAGARRSQLGPDPEATLGRYTGARC
jgi:hypothetical protein